MDLAQKLHQTIEEFELKEVINYKEYSEFMQSKIIRSPRTYTTMDYMTDEEVEETKRNNIRNLKPYDPTPLDIQKHFDFTTSLYLSIRNQHKESRLMNLLNTEEIGTILIGFTNWYEQFGFKYE